MYLGAIYFYLPTVTQGQTVTFTLKYEGFPINYYVHDPANNVRLFGKIESSTKSGSASFTASISGIYSVQCVPTDGIIDVFTLSFTVS